LTTSSLLFLFFLGFGYNSITKVSFSTKSYQGYGAAFSKKKKGAQDTKNQHPAGRRRLYVLGACFACSISQRYPASKAYGWMNA
jgi:hypothetical protein